MTRPLSARTSRRAARRRLSVHPLAGAILLAMAASAHAQTLPFLPTPPAVDQLPQEATRVSGEVRVGTPWVNPDTTRNTLTITQESRGAILEWASFSIGQNAEVIFDHRFGNNAVTLNRVMGSDPSQIMGSLTANGRVFITNPNGVLFGAGSQVNVGGLVASTLAISNDAFNAGVSSGEFAFTAVEATGSLAHLVWNQGSLNASQAGGMIGLLGLAVVNHGDIVANSGSALLAAGTTVTLDVGGDGLTQIASVTSVTAQPAQVETAGTMRADGGLIQLRSEHQGRGGSGISVTGLLAANTLEERTGRIILDAGDALVSVGSRTFAEPESRLLPPPEQMDTSILAVGADDGARGGSIEVRGRGIQILSLDNAALGRHTQQTLSASGSGGGGSIRLESTGEIQLLKAAAGGPHTIELSADAVNAGRAGSIDLVVDNGLPADSGVLGIHTTGAVRLSARGLGDSTHGGRINIDSAGGAAVFGLDQVGDWYGDVLLTVDGQTGGGSINVDAAMVAADHRTTLSASAVDDGAGGDIRMLGTWGLRAHGTLSARGAGTGNGGRIETSGSGLRLHGLTVDTGADGAVNGNWLIDPFNISIVHGDATGSFTPGEALIPLLDTEVQDGDINNALDAGTSVHITTGDFAVTAPASSGNIVFDDQYGDIEIISSSSTAVEFRLDAHRDIISDDGFTIQSNAAPLDVVFNAGLDPSGDAGTIELVQAVIRTGGGDVSLRAGSGQSSVTLGEIDAGNVLFSTATGSIGINGSRILATGDIGLSALGNAASTGLGIDRSSLTSTGGDIELVGRAGNLFGAFTQGVELSGGTSVDSSGHIEIRGLSEAIEGYPYLHHGVLIGGGARVGSADTTSVRVVGEVIAPDDQVGIGLGASWQPCFSAATGCAIMGQRIVLQGATPEGAAIETVGDFASVSAGQVINLRPGGVNADGSVREETGQQIAVGDGLAGTFNVTQDMLDRLDAPDLVIGSDVHTGGIIVERSDWATVFRDGNLTLQNEGDGSAGILLLSDINVDDGNTLALLSDGDILQYGLGDGILAESLLVRSNSGLVNLSSTDNDVGGTTLAGGAAGGFYYIDSNELSIGTVSALGFSAAGNSPLTVSANGIHAGGDLFVRNLAGNLTLLDSISAGAWLELVTAGTLQNPGGASLSAGESWTVWANTWEGENRGGVAGSGTLPNLYGCAFMDDSCTLGSAMSATDNQFIYANRPLATVTIDDITRPYGQDNPDLTYSVSGLVLGDVAANVLNGTPVTSASAASPTGSYPISGSFFSPAGYLVYVVPGALDITQAILYYVANPYSRLYGDPEGTLTGTVTGFVGSDTLESATSGTLVFTSSADITSPVGTYAITGSGLTSANYAFAQDPGNATAYRIDPATLLYVANPYSRAYGDAEEGPLTGTVTGFRNGDTLGTATSGTLVFTSDATIDSPAGLYAIDGSGLSAVNYVFAQDAGNATAYEILQATLVYVANPYSRFYGDPEDGPLTGTVTGLRNGDTLEGVTSGTLLFTSEATIDSPVGAYAITGSGLTSANYVFVQAPGNATAYQITPAVLLYTANPYSRFYGDAEEGPLTGTVTGFRNGDTLESATSGSLLFTSPATQASPVGVYAIDGSGLSAVNYVFEQAPGNATAYQIVPAVLLYTANPYSRLYGDPEDGPLTGTVTGFRNGDTLESVTSGSLLFTSPATQASPVGVYAIDGSGLSAVNYVFEQAPGNATAYRITPATLLYTANPHSRFFGEDNGVLTGTVTGFRNGDTLDSATTGTLMFTSPADRSSLPGRYAIDGSGLDAANYVFEQAPGNATALEVLVGGRFSSPSAYVPFPNNVGGAEQLNSYVNANLGPAPMCPIVSTTLFSAQAADEDDHLAREWSRVKSQPNMSNCMQGEQSRGCDDF